MLDNNLIWGYEWKSQTEINGWPLIHIAIGRSKITGRLITAKGIIAIGQFAKGIFVIAQFGIGVITIAQFGIGLLFGLGQFIFGLLVIGQFAIGILFSLGQFALGYSAIGQVTFGKFVYGQTEFGQYHYPKDIEAVKYFNYLKEEILQKLKIFNLF